MKRLTSLIVAMLMLLVLALPAYAATDTSRSYSFDLTVNGSGNAAAVEVGDILNLELTLRRLDTTTAESQALYGLQERVYFSSYLFQLVEESIELPQGASFSAAERSDSDLPQENFLNIIYNTTNGREGDTFPLEFVVARFQLKALQAGSYSFEGSSFKKVIDESGANTYVATHSQAINITVEGEPQKHTITVAKPTGGSITASPTEAAQGATITLTASPNSGYSFEGWDVSYTENGAKKSLDTTAQAVSSGAKATFTMPAANVTVNATFKQNSGSGNSSGGSSSGNSSKSTPPSERQILDPQTPLAHIKFSDVTEGHWSYQYVMFLAEKGFVNGKTATSFAPADPITRAEFVTILARMSGETLPASYSGPFTDVAAGAYYEQAVAWAVEAKIVKGTSETSFSPNNRILRQEIAAMIMRYAEHCNFTFTPYNPAQNFSDNGQIHSYALAAVSTMQQADILNGYEDGSFRPLNQATRAEVAKMLALVYEVMQP